MQSLLWNRFKAILQRPLGAGLSFAILCFTLVLTLLFWKMVELDETAYLPLSEAVGEIKFLHAQLERDMELLYSMRLEDSARIRYNASIVRDWSRQLTVQRQIIPAGGWQPSDSLLSQLWITTTYRVLLLERFLEGRRTLFRKLDSLQGDSQRLWSPAWDRVAQSLALGVLIITPKESRTASEQTLHTLWEQSRQQQDLLQRFRQVPALVVCDDILLQIRNQAEKDMMQKRRLQGWFYVFSLLLILALAVLGVRNY